MRSAVNFKLSKGQREAAKHNEAIRQRSYDRRAECVEVLRHGGDDTDRLLGIVVADRAAGVLAAAETQSLATQKPVEVLIGTHKIVVDMTGKRPSECPDHEPANIVKRIIDIHDNGNDYLRTAK